MLDLRDPEVGIALETQNDAAISRATTRLRAGATLVGVVVGFALLFLLGPMGGDLGLAGCFLAAALAASRVLLKVAPPVVPFPDLDS